ncbi:ABC transporter substrate-binding protein [Pseudonocardia spinosispora]|uniref:ABC transporter substrate-binding protein n=1 Tax=Pseudonocardia spinosispora TaxID=103441 RepID=UPI0003F6D38E|nr:ABC transporter substrate-binding protein [Pseudonocardia spinosispora]
MSTVDTGRPRPLLVGILLLTALTLLACGPARPDGAEAPAGPPRSGGTLRFAVSSDQGCLDPQQVTSNDTIYATRQLVDSLTDQDPATGRITPWLATEWQTNPDATAYTFTLRPDVMFSDGSPLTADVVKANFDRVGQLGARATLAKGYLAGYQGSTVSSPTQLTVHFATPNVQFLQGTSTVSLGLLSASALARSDDERCRQTVGSGPFVLAGYVQNQTITLHRRPGYHWGSPLWAHPGEAHLNAIEFQIVPESGVRTGSVESGEVDAIGSIGQQDELPLTDAGIRLVDRANPGLPFGISFNLSKPLVSDPSVRRALSLAIDRAEVASSVFTSHTKPATGVLASTTPDYTPAALGFDLQAANATLDAAGWHSGPDGVRAKDGTKLSFSITFSANAATNKPALELIQQQARRAGIELRIIQRPISDLPQIQTSGDFEALWGNITRADPDILRTYFFSGGANYYRLPPGPLDIPLTGQASATDPNRRAQLVAQAQQLLLTDYTTVPVVELSTVLGVAPGVQGIRFDASSRVTLSDVWKAQD